MRFIHALKRFYVINEKKKKTILYMNEAKRIKRIGINVEMLSNANRSLSRIKMRFFLSIQKTTEDEQKKMRRTCLLQEFQ